MKGHKYEQDYDILEKTQVKIAEFLYSLLKNERICLEIDYKSREEIVRN